MVEFKPVAGAVAPPCWEAGGLVEVFLVDVESSDCPCAAVHVLVVAPEGVIDAPLMEPVGDDADAVAAIVTDYYAVFVGCLCEALDVEELTAYEVDAWEVADADLIAHGGDYIILLDGSAVSALYDDEVFLRVPAFEA